MNILATRFRLRMATMSLYAEVVMRGLRARNVTPARLALALLLIAWWSTLAIGACVALYHAIAWGLRYV